MQAKPVVHENAVYSREEAADALGVSLSTLKRLIATGQLAASQPSGMRRVFIKGSSIIQMLDDTKLQNNPRPSHASGGQRR
jgi:excisionase family DNA binding protein